MKNEYHVVVQVYLGIVATSEDEAERVAQTLRVDGAEVIDVQVIDCEEA